ncbi:MAG: A24 family peptidase C-terminal domain-containing protein [Candidatus Thermoplasmatota archaeon]|nr:A24 family peptidase C-terminal domain-containing protein [Candidatus Thermoplasmatota archaeon]
MLDVALLDTSRFIVGVIILSYASFTDIKTRRAPNILWIILGGIGTGLLLIQYVLQDGFGSQTIYLIFIPIIIGIVYVFFQLRLIFGGADAKAIMALAILVPFQPIFFDYPLYNSLMPFSWVIFSNSIVIFLFVPLSLFIYNIFKRNIRFPHCFLGYRMSLAKAKEKFVWPLEHIVDGHKYFSYVPHSFESEDLYSAFEEAGYKHIWVTPKVPFMIPLLVGFISSFIIGDILFTIMQCII